MTPLLDMLFCGDWVDRAVALIATVAFAILMWLIGYGVYVACDSWFLDDRDGVAAVCGRTHVPANSSTIYHSDGKGGGWTQFINHPDSWYVFLRLDGKEDDFGVSEHTYTRVVDKQRVNVRYRTGRFSGWLYITEADFSTP